uniref:Integrin, alpha 9 n=1 Tax=Gadus morhua TaxID=8049 RepID=A0A8C5AZI6_GADMO
MAPPLTLTTGVRHVFCAFLWISLTYSYNIDLEHPIVFRGPESSFFGYSVLQHYHNNTRWVLVGAPKANSSYSSSVHTPGALYKCRVHSNPEHRCTEIDLGRGQESCGKTCHGDRDDEWMGVSLARQDKPNGQILACAHRWKNVFYEKEQFILPHGYCSIIPPNLQGHNRALIPCYEGKKYGEEHGSCQAGIAGVFTEELVVMGAPGSYYWTGTIKVYNMSSNTFYNLNKEEVKSDHFKYLGYAVTAGHFSAPNVMDVAAGAPQSSGSGKVGPLALLHYVLNIIVWITMGSYFGSSLCGVDLNRDGLSDLLVGAPMHSHVRDEGQVTVYLSRGNGLMEEAAVLKGDNAYNAHFGESIAAIGDIDDDGYQDVAIGAPKEEEFAGAVYIYHGDSEGIITKYSMRLSGRTISPGLQMFGQTRPVISVDVFIFLPVSINITVPQCHKGPQNLNCFNLSACLQFRGRQVPGQIELLYNLTADADKRQRGQPSRIYFSQNGVPVSVLSQQLNLDINREVCQHFTAYVKKDVKDPGQARLGGASGGHLPALAPVLRWKKGGKIAAKNETFFEKNCLSDDCAADLRLSGQLLLSGYLYAVRNISLNLTVSNTGDDAYDTNIYFNFSREVFYINFWQKEEKGISCELVELDFLKCSVGFPFMRAQTQVETTAGKPRDTMPLQGLTITPKPLVSPSSFVYGSSVDASRFVQLEDMECNFQPLNLTFQVINNGPSRLPGSTVDIRLPNRLSGSGADMFHILDTQVGVANGRGNCTLHKNPSPCTIPQDQESIFHTIFAFFTKSGRRVLDCNRPGRACMTISCSLGPQLKDEPLSIEVKLLLNTEILKRDSSSVIQFVTRAHVQVDNRAMEVPNGLPDEISLLFEALHSQEPRGYVVGWIIAISLLVGILIFLLLAVLLWKMGFFRRRYRDIIEAEKNRKDSDESWDWMDKDH